MLFNKEEKIVKTIFNEAFADNITLLDEESGLLSEILESSQTKQEKFSKYSLILLAGLNLKGQ